MAPRIPLHLPVLVGVSATLYSGGLAAVSGLQAGHEAAKVAAREPAAMDVEAISRSNDLLESTLGALDGRLGPLAAAAAEAEVQARHLFEQREALEREIEALTGEQAATVRRAVATVVPKRSTTAAVSAPTTVATTGASGAP